MPVFASPGNMFCNPFCCFSFVAKERSETLIELNFDRFGILERLFLLGQIFSICFDNTKYEKALRLRTK